MLSLRQYQTEAVEAVESGYKRGISRPLVALPTGTGKTIVFGEIIRRRRAGRSLVLAHRNELIDQAEKKIRLINPAANIGIVKAERDEHEAPIVLASVQTLAMPWRLARISADFDTIVVDEAHHATADTYIKVLEHVGAFSAGGPLTLGVTATPERADGTPLGDVWQEIVYSADILKMIRTRYLADLRAVRVHLEADLDEVHTRAGDLIASELADALRAANAPRHAVEAYLEHASGRKTLIFTPTVALAHDMADAFSDAGISAEALDGATATDKRRAILDRLHSGETQVVANCAVLTEGFDEPSIDCIIIARPTKSRPLYTQMIGRGTRPFPKKADCLIIDLVGASKRHKLITAATLFGLELLGMEDGESIAEAAGRQENALAVQQAHGRLVAETVNLFEDRELKWIASNANRYVLSVGDGLLLLHSSDLAAWSVEHVNRDRQRTQIAENLDLGYAQGVAEDYARKIGAGALINKAARWRSELATEKQVLALRRWRIPIRKGLTKGEASDLLAAAMGRAA